MSKLREAFDSLGEYRRTPAAHGYPVDLQHLFAPIDKVHEALVALCEASELSLACAMYGWDDDEIDALFKRKLEDERVPVLLALDKTQAAGVHERKILAGWQPDLIGNTILLGKSVHGAISHDKLCVIDGQLTICGSTNWSLSGEQKQNNEAVIVWDAVFAAESRARIDCIASEMHSQMLQKGELTS